MQLILDREREVFGREVQVRGAPFVELGRNRVLKIDEQLHNYLSVRAASEEDAALRLQKRLALAKKVLRRLLYVHRFKSVGRIDVD